MSHNPVVMWELATHDQVRSVEFRRKLFDWPIEFQEDLGFYLIPAPELEKQELYGGGVFTVRKAKLPFLTIYIRVDDIEAKAAQIEAEGGCILEAPHQVPGGSTICLFNEPSGVTLGIYQIAEQANVRRVAA